MGRITKASLFGLLLATASLTGCAPHTIEVTSPGMNGMEGLRVSGQGEARGAPDVAKATLGVEVRAATSQDATRQVNEQMTAVIAALKGAGVPDKDIRTEQVSIYFEQEMRPPVPYAMEMAPATAPANPPGKSAPAKPPPPPEPELPKGFYRASNTVEVTIRDLDKASAILTAGTNAGANSMYGLRFELEDNSKVLSQAREKAVADARKNAEELARLSGVKLGPIVSINENRGFSGPIMPMAMKAEAARDASMPVERGELTVSSQVDIVYSLEK